MCGYSCGPSGVAVPKTGKYCVRPIYNIDGMSRGASVQKAKKGDYIAEPGYFWCEYFEGEHYSVDFKNDRKNKKWIQDVTVLGIRKGTYKFTAWKKIGKKFYIPWSNGFDNVDYINIEYIGSRPIEMHLRRNYNFANHSFSELRVAWESDGDIEPPGKGWTFIKSEQDLGIDKRKGFYAR